MGTGEAIETRYVGVSDTAELLYYPEYKGGIISSPMRLRGNVALTAIEAEHFKDGVASRIGGLGIHTIRNIGIVHATYQPTTLIQR